MSRSLPVWLLTSALVAFVGCGGGGATDSGPVASSDSDATSAGGEAAMPTGGSGMETPGGDMTSSSGGEGAYEDMYGSGGDAGDASTTPSPEGYGPGGPDYSSGESSVADPSIDPAAMSAAYESGSEAYPGGDSSGGAPSIDPAALAAAYQSGEGAYPGGNSSAGTAATDPAAMAATYQAAEGTASAEGAYPGGAYPGGESSGGAYPGGPGGGAVEEKVPEGFDGKAQLAFRRGKEKDAMQYLYAHALTTDAGAESLLPTMRWVQGWAEPKLAVRWGVGFVVTAPRNFGGDPKPVGSQQNIPTRGGAAGGNEGYAGAGAEADYGAASGAEGGGGGNGIKNSLLAKGAGELGEKLAAAYSERVSRADFGEVLKQAMEAGAGGNRGGGGAEASGYGAGASYEAAGSAGPGYGAKDGAEPTGPGGGGAAAATEVIRLMPGLSMLGIGAQNELIERASEDGIDAVVIIEVKLAVNTRTNLVTNDSKLVLFETEVGKKPLHTTKAFNNISIQKARAEGKEDGVDREFEKLIEAIDANFTMTELPAILSAQVAANRIATEAAKPHDNPLPILVEARMYHSRGLLEESALFAAYEQILGVDRGRLLSTGTEEEKEKVLSQWLPES